MSSNECKEHDEPNKLAPIIPSDFDALSGYRIASVTRCRGRIAIGHSLRNSFGLDGASLVEFSGHPSIQIESNFEIAKKDLLSAVRSVSQTAQLDVEFSMDRLESTKEERSLSELCLCFSFLVWFLFAYFPR